MDEEVEIVLAESASSIARKKAAPSSTKWCGCRPHPVTRCEWRTFDVMSRGTVITGRERRDFGDIGFCLPRYFLTNATSWNGRGSAEFYRAASMRNSRNPR